MGGFFGTHERIPGKKIQCNLCNQVLDETNFGWSKVRGYYPYCIPCNRIKLKQSRDKHREDRVKQNGVTRHKMETLMTEAYQYKIKLQEVAEKLIIGDIFKVGGRKLRVEKIYGSYVLMLWQGGGYECFVWDDVYRIVNGTYRRLESNA